MKDFACVALSKENFIDPSYTTVKRDKYNYLSRNKILKCLLISWELRVYSSLPCQQKQKSPQLTKCCNVKKSQWNMSGFELKREKRSVLGVANSNTTLYNFSLDQ